MKQTILLAGALTIIAACTKEKEVERYFNVNAATPQILAQPQSKSILVGESYSLEVDAMVSTQTELTYKWYKGTKRAGDESQIFWDIDHVGEGTTLPINTNVEGTTYYRVLVTNTDPSAATRGGNTLSSVMSNIAEVKVGTKSAPKPEFDSRVEDGTYAINSAVYLQVRMKGQDDVIRWKYHWYLKDSLNAPDSTEWKQEVRNSDADNNTTSSYIYVPNGWAGTKYVVVAVTAVIADGSAVTDTAATTIISAKLTVRAAMVRIKAIADVACVVGDADVHFKVETEGVLPSNALSYSWQRKQVVAGETEWVEVRSFAVGHDTLQVNTTERAEDVYRVVVRSVSANPADTMEATSREVRLIVNRKQASAQISSFQQTGSDIVVSATGNGTLSYQWHKLSGGVDAELSEQSTTLASPSNNACYYVIVTDRIAATTATHQAGEASTRSSNVCVN